MVPCPTCAAGLRFDIASQKMACDYCHNYFDPLQLTDNSARDDAKTQPYFDSFVYICPSCGAEIVTTDKNDAIGFCQYCGGASMIFDKIRKEWKPDAVVPFKITKEQCKEAYTKEVKKNPFIGGKYRKPQTMDSFRGIYMPYWSYHGKLQGEFRIGTTAPRRHVSGNTYQIDHFDIQGFSDYRLDGYSHDASVTFDDDLSESIAPYKVEGQMPFAPGFLSGFYAETGDVDPHEYDAEIKNQINEDAQRIYTDDLSVANILKSKSLSVEDGKCKIPAKIQSVSRSLNPVWFMSCRSKDSITYAAVNGQTGKVAADLPLSPVRILITALGIAAAVFALILGFMTFLPSIKANMTLALCTLLAFSGMYYLQRSFNATVDKNGQARKSKGGGFTVLATIAAFVGIILMASDGSYDGDLRFVGMVMTMIGGIVILFSNITQATDSSRIKKMKIENVSQLRVRISEEARWFLNKVIWLKIVMLLSIGASIIVILVDPAFNVISYAFCVLLALELFGLALYHIFFQTRVAKRPLPQFKKEGAYYDAK